MQTNYSRAVRILDRLDARVERQTFLPLAPIPSAVAVVNAFHDRAGSFERLVLPRIDCWPIADVAESLRSLKATVDLHRSIAKGERS